MKGVTRGAGGFMFAAAALMTAALVACGPGERRGDIKVSMLVGGAEQGAAGGWTALKLNDAISAAARVRTGEDAMIDLAIFEHAGLRLLAKSEVDLTAVTGDDIHLKFDDGNILMKVGRLEKGRRLRVETPTAVASIRGTQFWGQVRKEGKAGTFAVREGSIEITMKKTSKTVTLKAGEALDYSADQAVLETRSAKVAEIEAMSQIDGIRLPASVK
ncbi:MAG: iron dicitrate transport regulator FecR [Spirochaetes bacterium]|nr:MAG: iron dicitrate transport regulator FecR [Spirochaetota bacterium]